MSNLKTLLLPEIEQGFQIKAFEDGLFGWDYPLKYQDAKRFQYVYLSEYHDEGKSRDYIYIRSFICEHKPGLDLAGLLREAEYGYMSMVCLKPYTTKDGIKTEAFYAQCLLPLEAAQNNKNLFLDVVHEIASNADYIEKKFVGGDAA